MQSELKPCPFCGSDRLMVLPPTCDRDTPYSAADRAYPVVRCSGCYTDVPGKDFDASSKSAVEAWNRRSLTAALSDKQAVEVKALEWHGDGDCYAFAEVTHTSYSIAFEEGRYWANWNVALPPFDTLDAAKAAAQTDYEQRIRSALVDVPAVEPVAWRWESAYGGEDLIGQWQVSTVKPSRSEDATDFICEPLYASPPLSREGEDSAEVVEGGAKILAKWIGYAWDGLSDRDISAEYKDWAYNGIGALVMQGGKPALRKVAASILALAATRSGSATGTKGCADE